MRGNRPSIEPSQTNEGSIPASAGKPSVRRSQGLSRRVYPRECGETMPPELVYHLYDGLSPRVRGNRGEPAPAAQLLGSIPASAGKPPSSTSPDVARRVYPRECGETVQRRPTGFPGRGLSPRVRGNPTKRRPPRRRCGSIPASAGKPPQPRHRHRQHQVYPRECGETFVTKKWAPQGAGLSPRVRGNQELPAVRQPFHGSIPASAGKPGE